MAVRYGTLVRYPSIFAKKYSSLVRYAFFVMVRIRYVGTLFELKIPDFSHIAPTFCIQRQKTAETDAKCMNWDRSFISKWFQRQLNLRVGKSKDGSTVRYVGMVRYGTPQFLLKCTVRLFRNDMGTVRWYGTLRKLNWITVRWYGTVQRARYVVRKFWTYRTVLPPLVANVD